MRLAPATTPAGGVVSAKLRDRNTFQRQGDARKVDRGLERSEEPPAWAKELLLFNKATERRLKSLEDEVKAAGKRAGRKRERSPVPDFKYKHNRTQYDFNRKVLNKIETALEASDEEEREQALGFLVDLERGYFQVPDRRIQGCIDY